MLVIFRAIMETAPHLNERPVYVKELPENVMPYKRTPEFTEQTVPQGLLTRHKTRTATWGEIVVLEGSLTYRILLPEEKAYRLVPGHSGIIEPTVLHEVDPDGEVRFYIQFYREPVTRRN